jgi:predicted outer membrane protein
LNSDYADRLLDEDIEQGYKEVRRFTSEYITSLVDNGYEPKDILSEAYIIGAAEIDAIDRRIASYEARRMAVMRAVDAYNEKFARKLEAARDIVDAEFTDLPTKKA